MEKLSDGVRTCLKPIRVFFTKKSDEPFRYLTIGLSCLYFFSEAVAIGLSVLAGVWLADEAKKRQCVISWNEDKIIWPTLFGASCLYWYFAFVMASKVKDIFRSKLDFSFEREIPEISEADTIEFNGRLGPTTRALRKIVEQAQAGEVPLLTATAFLRSDRGRKFLKQVERRVIYFLGVLERSELVRTDWRAYRIFAYIVAGTVMASMAGAFQAAANADSAAQKCSLRFLYWEFLNYFSLSLLAILAVMAFAGVGTMTELASEPVRNEPLTQNEKFLICLLAANTDEPFYGVARSVSSGYAQIAEEGEEDVFMPIHMSLFAFKPVRVADKGDVRPYSQEFEDCVGNFVVGAPEV